MTGLKKVASAAFALVLALTPALRGQEGLPPVPTLESQLLAENPDELADAARRFGEAARGAVLFYQQHTTCTKCHAFGDEKATLGPDLTRPDKKRKITDAFLIDAILNPSKDILDGFEPVMVITDDGLTVTGLLVEDHPERLVLRDPNKDGELVTIRKDEIDERAESVQSIMPPGVANQLANRQQFLDLLRYVIEITEGGPQRALELEPDPSTYAPPPLPEYEKRVDHAGMIAELNGESFNRGKEIYERLCVNCHGTKDEPGSLPTSLRFASGKFRNGSDPHGMYKTLTHGFGLMVPQTWMVPKQKYDAVHYIREAYLKEHNPSQYAPIAPGYLAGLPKGDTHGPEPSKFEPWVAMDYGPNLTATYEIGLDGSNFAYKGIAVRLDGGAGGVTRGGYWMIFDEDTLRVAGAWSGEQFIDYNAIMLNGKHGVHPRIVGRLHFENKTGPGWANPDDGAFADPRFLGRDERPYGPLPRDWAHYKGLYHHGNHAIVSYTVGKTAVLEMPGVDTSEMPAVFTRTLNVGPRDRDMVLQVAEQGGSDFGLHPVAGSSEPASDTVALFGPGGALIAEEPPVVEEPAAPDVVGETAALAFNGATHVEIARPNDFEMSQADYTVFARIKTQRGGTILSKASPSNSWIRDGKTFFVRGGKLVFDVGWVGNVTSRSSVADGRWHDVAVTYEHRDGRVRLFVDGRLDGQGRLKPKSPVQGHVVRIGYTANNFPAPTFFDGRISDVRFFARTLDDAEIGKVAAGADPAEDMPAAWQTDRVAGDTIRDTTGRGHDGRVVRGKPTAKAAPAQADSLRGMVVAGLSQPIEGAKWLATEQGQLRLLIPAGNNRLKFALSIARVEKASELTACIARLAADESAVDLAPLCRGGPPRWPGSLPTEGHVGDDEGPFAIDVLTHPVTNPWFCRVRLTGFDFMPDGHRAAVCSWDGSVWMVAGIDQPQDGLTWQRIASGMFQPLGVKVVDGEIYVACRDQIAVLHDLNGDGETDYYENFNNDHQVTEHFHEFAMGLQADRQGNFYYAKSARHAKTALVPHHGTLLKVSKDGSKTEILAKGFRAANGVCLNPDGSFMVTDQEGHWNPKNRINWVVPHSGSFYGNMYGYHDVTDPSDEAMEQPLCWITNSFDRSPAELIWVTSDAWGPLKGQLLNTSYGYGMVYVVPFEKLEGRVQGGMCRLPIPMFPTGVMRPRFHPADGQLYLCGMFAWAGSRNQPGGFYRLRYTGRPVHLPVGLRATTQGVAVTFSGELDAESASTPDNYSVKIWGLKRSAGYGSPHVNERALEVAGAALSADRKTVRLSIPEIEPTWCMEIRYRLKGTGGEPVDNMIHNSIFRLGKPE